MKLAFCSADLTTIVVCLAALIPSLGLIYVYTRFLRGVDHVSHAVVILVLNLTLFVFCWQRVPERILWFRNYRIATTVISALLAFAIWKRSLFTDKFPDADLVLYILYFINLIIDIYIVLCVHSLYKKFEDETLPIKNCPAVIERLQLAAE